MEKKEMEIVRHTTMNHLEVFIVEMTSRGFTMDMMILNLE